MKVDEWLALAAALNVAPLHLAVPRDGKAEFEVAGETTSAQHIRAWVRGRSPLIPNPSTRDYLDFIAEWPESELLPEMKALVTRAALPDSSPAERELLLVINSDLRERLEQRAGDLVWEIREGEALRRDKEADDG